MGLGLGEGIHREWSRQQIRVSVAGEGGMGDRKGGRDTMSLYFMYFCVMASFPVRLLHDDVIINTKLLIEEKKVGGGGGGMHR